MLALIAGQGALPGLLYAHLAAAGTAPVLAELHDQPAGLPGPAIRFRLETFATLLAALKERGVDQVCLAGGIARPSFDPGAVDPATRPLLPLIAKALQLGDDGALRVALGLFEDAGFAVRAAQDILPDLLPPPGVLSRRQPAPTERTDARRGAAIINAMAAADVGQSCVVSASRALALEATGGTDWMLASIGQDRRPDNSRGGILFKAPKVAQDRRVDMPAIGPATVSAVIRAGLTGIVIEAGGVLVLDLPATRAAADRDNILLWARPVE
ncbi:MAG: LpxI family protein [Paracoccaceae bacterium]